ncbi:sulfur oxidation protein SoxY [Sulfurifustis variabilis]|uniref:Sulfur oxidation protein SoxY n=1 Tax=Sulfurifustis variabilis TaxID=1675686 RepID=A0A1B4VCF6_9GAMM|nr:thiosulfate oxidation carrier protein SoxY [Sulfurifustis variabilis]BAU49201.1 sulfur oxidation protein SoxY [Sulfurifustis variabilis]
MTNRKRRTFLKQGLASALVGAGASAGLLAPARLLAEWPRQAFEAKGVDDALRGLYGGASPQAAPEGAITIKAPGEAENGAVVPITITTNLPNVRQVAILGEKNPIPLIASAAFSGALPYLAMRIKMGESSDVHVVVETADGLYRARRNVRVAVGGCGA